MAGFTVTALDLDQNGTPSRCTIAVSVTDINGLGVQNLNESNFIIRDITSGADVSIAELRSVGLPGFYRLLLRTDALAKAGTHVLALFVASRQHAAGRIPEGMDNGSTMVKVRVA